MVFVVKDIIMIFRKIKTISILITGFYRTQYSASYTHKSLGRTRQFTVDADMFVVPFIKIPNSKVIS